MSIIVHHLNNSRSQRILWLLEELNLSYDIRHHARDAVTNLAPDALLKVHPLGKLVPARGTDLHIRYLEFMHFAEGSVMTPILLNLYTARLGEAAAPLHPRIQQQLDSHFAFMDETLKATGWFVGDSLTGADIMMSFPAEAAVKMGKATNLPNLSAFVEKIHARPAFQTALEKGGPYAYA